jgi:hypothetical protein
MPHTYHLEIKTFSISPALKQNKMSAAEIGKNIFGLNETTFNQTSFIEHFKSFVFDGFDSLKKPDGFIVNDSITKKFKVVQLIDNLEYNSFIGIYIGGTIGEKGKFNKKSNGIYKSQIMGPDDFTDIPFLFYIHFSVDSSVGVIMLYRTSSRSMNQEIKAMIKEIFFNKGYSLRYHNFISDNQKESFKNFSIVDKIVISQNVRGIDMTDEYSFFAKEKEYRIKIEISGIDESANNFFKRIFKQKKKSKKTSIKSMFPEFKDLGIDREKASIKTIVNEKGGQLAKPDFKDYETYFDKLLPKINLNDSSSIEYGNSNSFTYSALLTELNGILVEEVWPTLNKEDESE